MANISEEENPACLISWYTNDIPTIITATRIVANSIAIATSATAITAYTAAVINNATVLTVNVLL